MPVAKATATHVLPGQLIEVQITTADHQAGAKTPKTLRILQGTGIADRP